MEPQLQPMSLSRTAMKQMPDAEFSAHELRFIKEKFPDKGDFEKAKRRLAAHEPLGYILGEWYFYDETYKVSPDCLIPRPETEHLVEKLIKLLPQGGRFADLCTGSGCIAISTLSHRPDCTAVAVDISEKALALARENAVLNNVSERVDFLCADIKKGNCFGDESFDIIVSNPPYIAADIISILSPEVQSEPRIALDGGEDGLDFYRVLLNEYTKNIKSGGYLIMEIGYDQGRELQELCSCNIFKDYSGNDRVAVLKV